MKKRQLTQMVTPKAADEPTPAEIEATIEAAKKLARDLFDGTVEVEDVKAVKETRLAALANTLRIDKAPPKKPVAKAVVTKPPQQPAVSAGAEVIAKPVFFVAEDFMSALDDPIYAAAGSPLQSRE